MLFSRKMMSDARRKKKNVLKRMLNSPSNITQKRALTVKLDEIISNPMT